LKRSQTRLLTRIKDGGTTTKLAKYRLFEQNIDFFALFLRLKGESSRYLVK